MDKRRLTRKLRVLLLIAAASGLLSGCASDHPPHMSATHGDVSSRVANARTSSDHHALAKFFLEEAGVAQRKADEHRSLIGIYSGPAYQAGTGLPFRRALEPSKHCQLLVRLYEQAASENLAMAKVHEELAAQAGTSK